MKSTHPLPEKSQQKGGVIRRMGHLRPENYFPESVTDNEKLP